MTSITINIPEEHLQQLEYLAQKSQVSAEELLRTSIENWLASSRSDFSQAANYVLKKNAELYQRLA